MRRISRTSERQSAGSCAIKILKACAPSCKISLERLQLLLAGWCRRGRKYTLAEKLLPGHPEGGAAAFPLTFACKSQSAISIALMASI